MTLPDAVKRQFTAVYMYSESDPACSDKWKHNKPFIDRQNYIVT